MFFFENLFKPPFPHPLQYIIAIPNTLLSQLRSITHAPSVQMYERPEDSIDAEQITVPKNGVGDTQFKGNIDKLGGGQAYADNNTGDDDEFSEAEAKVL